MSVNIRNVLLRCVRYLKYLMCSVRLHIQSTNTCKVFTKCMFTFHLFSLFIIVEDIYMLSRNNVFKLSRSFSVVVAFGIFSLEERRRFSVCTTPPDILACMFVPLHCETLGDGTA